MSARGAGAGRPLPRRGGRRLRTRPVVVVAAVLVLVVAGLFVAAAILGDDDGKAPAAVTVAGVDVSHMDAKGILAVTRRRARELLNQRVVITRADTPLFRVATTRRELGASPRIRVALDAALEPRSLGGRVISTVGLAPTRDVPITFSVDPAKVDALVGRVTDQINTDPRASTVKVSDTEIAVVPGAGGYGVDPTVAPPADHRAPGPDRPHPPAPSAPGERAGGRERRACWRCASSRTRGR